MAQSSGRAQAERQQHSNLPKCAQHCPERTTFVSRSDQQRWDWKKVAASVLKWGALAAVVCVLAFGVVDPAEAARSGGRVGGSSFSAARSSGGLSGARSFGGSSMSPSLGSGTGIGRPSTGFSSFFGPSIGFGYGYGGYGYGQPVGGGGGGLFSLLFYGFVAFVLFQVAQSVLTGGDSSAGEIGGGKVSVAKVQVGLLGSARSLKRDLDRIAGRADTNTPEGLHYVMQETVLSLLRNPDYCIYGLSSLRKERSLDAGEDRFNEISMQERGKFKEETLVNFGGRTKRKPGSGSGTETMSDLMVVTILVAADADLKIPRIRGREDLKSALNKLGALRSEQVLAVEVLWTPEDENDSYHRDELFEDYPELVTL
eukprot:jgi/Astpho2/2919/Aster-01066